MKINKIYYLVFTIILSLLSCKKETKKVVSNLNTENRKVELNNDCLNNRATTSIVHSCGGGCAVSYTEKKVSVIDSFIKIEYVGKSYINEEIEEEFGGSFYIRCNNKNIASSAFFEGEPDENMLDVKVNSTSESFQKYSDELCSCIISAETTQQVTTKIDLNDFIGTWEYIENPNNEDIPYGVYTIEIEKKDDKLIGKYCAIAQSGNRIDCSSENDYNLDIKYINGYLNVDFYSFFGAKYGKARISLVDNNLFWEIVETPKNGEFYIPNSARFVNGIYQKEKSPANQIPINEQGYSCEDIETEKNIYEEPLYKICECDYGFSKCYSIFYDNSDEYYQKLLLKNLPKKDTTLFFNKNFPFTEYSIFQNDSIKIMINEEGGESEYIFKKNNDKTHIEFYAYPP